MNKNRFEKLSGLEQMLFLNRRDDLRIADNWQGCLELIEGMLAGDDSLTRANRALWFHRAICLDMLARPTEALTILKALVEVFPLQYEYANSLEVSLNNTARFAINKYEKDRSNPLIEQYFNAVREVDYSPWGLTDIYIDYLILAGQVEKAKQLALDYVDLSPNDYDYLKKAVEVSQKINDFEMQTSVLAQVATALRLNPGDDLLASLLTLSVNEANRESA
jgi:hypothetical protein